MDINHWYDRTEDERTAWEEEYARGYDEGYEDAVTSIWWSPGGDGKRTVSTFKDGGGI